MNVQYYKTELATIISVTSKSMTFFMLKHFTVLLCL